MPTWCVVYCVVVLGFAVVECAAILRGTLPGSTRARRRLPRWYAIAQLLSALALVALVWCYWYPEGKAALGVICIPLFAFVVVVDALGVHWLESTIAAELNAEPDPPISKETGLLVSLGFAFLCLLPGYIMAGLLCIEAIRN